MGDTLFISEKGKMLLILIIPTVIICSIIVTYYVLSKGLSSYIDRIEAKAKKIQRISILLIASELVDLFSKSETKALVDKILEGSNGDDDHMFSSLTSSFGGAGSEIERLYLEINNAYKPSAELSRIKISAIYLRATLLLYGFSVSFSQYVIAVFFFQAGLSVLSPAIIDMIIGTVLFSSIFVYISVYIILTSRRIELGYSRLQDSGLRIQHETN